LEEKLLTAEEVRHVAMLARLGLTDEEVEKFRVQLLDVLGYIDMLQKVDTSAIPPTAQILSHMNVMREDEARPSWPVADILGNAPAQEDGFIRVPPVLEEVRSDTVGEANLEANGEEAIG
jgi:aspartyl-tRNA(Asn)/glutamyl-tRNA(Gln) amidotransferase subunit C